MFLWVTQNLSTLGTLCPIHVFKGHLGLTCVLQNLYAHAYPQEIPSPNVYYDLTP